jgi:Uma2 family endonuclease
MSLDMKLMTPAEFAPYAEDAKYELLDGELSEREISIESTMIGAVIYEMLAEFSRRTGAGKAFPENIPFRCFTDAASRVRKPDVSWFQAARWKTAQRTSVYIETTPDLVVEVLSPTDVAYDVDRKADQFFRAGIQEAWIVHPHVEQVERRFADGAARWYGKDEVIDAAPLIPGFTWTLAEVLAKA